MVRKILQMVSVINIELEPDEIEMLPYSSSPCHNPHKEEEEKIKTQIKVHDQHKVWCSFHPKNFVKRNRRVKIAENITRSVQSRVVLPHSGNTSTTTSNSANSVGICVKNCDIFRSELNLSGADIPSKDIKILNLLLRR